MLSYDLPPIVGIGWWRRAFRSVGARLAACGPRFGCCVVGVRGMLIVRGHGIYCRQFWREHYRADDPHHWYGDNLEDPNHRGYDAIRRRFLIEIVKALPE